MCCWIRREIHAGILWVIAEKIFGEIPRQKHGKIVRGILDTNLEGVHEKMPGWLKFMVKSLGK